MKRSKRTYALAVAAVLGVLGLGTTAASAQAYSWSVNIGGPSSGTAGQTLTLKIGGQNPTPDYPDYYWFSTWLSVDVIPTSVVSSCPDTHYEGFQLGSASRAQGGGYLVFTQRENVDTAGTWSTTVGYTPPVPGRMLICAYSDDGYANTLAKAQHVIDVGGPASGGKRCRHARKRATSSASPVATPAKKKCKRRRR
jgi:hypothetical protein